LRRIREKALNPCRIKGAHGIVGAPVSLIVNLLRCGRDLPTRDIRVPRCAGSAEIIHHPMKHGLTGRVVDSPYFTFHRLVAEGVYPEGRTGRHAATCGHAAQ
jgi:hypothetical protein